MGSLFDLYRDRRSVTFGYSGLRLVGRKNKVLSASMIIGKAKETTHIFVCTLSSRQGANHHLIVESLFYYWNTLDPHIKNTGFSAVGDGIIHAKSTNVITTTNVFEAP